MTFPVNLTLTCYDEEKAILNFSYYGPRAVSLKVCYYFEALLWLQDVNNSWRKG